MFRKHRGQALVEFALILPILLLLAFGCIDLGRVFYYQEAVTNVAREGARYGALHPTATDIASHAQQETNISGVNVQVSPAAPVPVGTGQITVTATYDFQLVTPIVQSLLQRSSLTVKGVSTMPMVGH